MRSHLGLLGANGKEVGQNWWTQGLHLGGRWLYMNLKYIARSFPNHSYVWGEDRWLWNNQVNWVPCQHVGGGFVFNLLAKCWPVVSHILQIFYPFSIYILSGLTQANLGWWRSWTPNGIPTKQRMMNFLPSKKRTALKQTLLCLVQDMSLYKPLGKLGLSTMFQVNSGREERWAAYTLHQMH